MKVDTYSSKIHCDANAMFLTTHCPVISYKSAASTSEAECRSCSALFVPRTIRSRLKQRRLPW